MGFNPSDVDWGEPKGELTKNGPSYTSKIYMLMVVYWGDKLNCTSYRNSMVDTNGHNIFEIDWRDHRSSSNHMTEFLFSEVDWGAHDSSLFLFLVNFDFDAKPIEF